MRRFWHGFQGMTAALWIASSAVAQPAPAATVGAPGSDARRIADDITVDQLRAHLEFVSSDLIEGRDTPSRGLDLSAAYIAAQLSRLGVRPAGDPGSYFQRATVRRERIDPTKASASINGVPLIYGRDFLPMDSGATVTGGLVFVSHGFVIKPRGIDPYKGVDIKGKIVVVAPTLPRGITSGDFASLKPGVDWVDPLHYAKAHGAIGLIEIAGQRELENWDKDRSEAEARSALAVDNMPALGDQFVPSIRITPQAAQALFRGERYTAEQIIAGMTVAAPPAAFPLRPGKTATIALAFTVERKSTQNVVGIIEGSDPALKNEYVAISAHYDHLGIGEPVNGDAIYNGADDDGSGVVAVLAIAEALVRSPVRPKRSILLIWHFGEERGLLGSKYFTSFPTVPLERIVTAIDIDMIGRSKANEDADPRNEELTGPEEIYLVGSRKLSSSLGMLAAQVNSNYLGLRYNYKYDDPKDPLQIFSRSDDYSYARRGVPVLFFFSGIHADYHQPSDTIDKIDFGKMQKVTRTVLVTALTIADLPERPRVDTRLDD